MDGQFERNLYSLRCSGYLRVPQVFDSADLDRYNAAAQAWVAELDSFTGRTGESLPYVAGWPLRNARALYAVAPIFQQLITHDVIQRYAQSYLGKALVRDCHYLCNMPDPANRARGTDGDVNWHRDKKWLPDDDCSALYLHSFVLLTDFTAENGATLLVPGTHREREPGYYFLETTPGATSEGNYYKTYPRDFFPSSVQVTGKRGDLLLFDPMVIHAQGINVTPDIRSAINVTFHRADRSALFDCRHIAERHGRFECPAAYLQLLASDPAALRSYGPLGASETVTAGA